jgi:hypothetical protein
MGWLGMAFHVLALDFQFFAARGIGFTGEALFEVRDLLRNPLLAFRAVGNLAPRVVQLRGDASDLLVLQRQALHCKLNLGTEYGGSLNGKPQLSNFGKQSFEGWRRLRRLGYGQGRNNEGDEQQLGHTLFYGLLTKSLPATVNRSGQSAHSRMPMRQAGFDSDDGWTLRLVYRQRPFGYVRSIERSGDAHGERELAGAGCKVAQFPGGGPAALHVFDAGEGF